MPGIRLSACRMLTGCGLQNIWCAQLSAMLKGRFPLNRRVRSCNLIMLKDLQKIRTTALRRQTRFLSGLQRSYRKKLSASLQTNIFPFTENCSPAFILMQDITKKEWVLGGETVIYGSASELKATLEYDFSEEKKFSYRGLSMDELIHHLSLCVSRLWQIHVFS